MKPKEKARKNRLEKSKRKKINNCIDFAIRWCLRKNLYPIPLAKSCITQTNKDTRFWVGDFKNLGLVCVAEIVGCEHCCHRNYRIKNNGVRTRCLADFTWAVGIIPFKLKDNKDPILFKILNAKEFNHRNDDPLFSRIKGRDND